MKMNNFLVVSPEVQHALDNHLPVVALESTIISHGMPWPQNAVTAKSVEDTVRQHGAVPATIAIKDGKCFAGLSPEDIDYFAQAKNVWKVSLRDMPFVIAQKLPGATTVAATMRIASMAGIKIFATGGIGGVHRGAAETMDISADLTEMGQTNVAIVAAGVKSILDIAIRVPTVGRQGIHQKTKATHPATSLCCRTGSPTTRRAQSEIQDPFAFPRLPPQPHRRSAGLPTKNSPRPLHF